MSGKLRITIGFKLIFITSIILALSLTGLSFLTAYFFNDDAIKRIQQTTREKSQFISLQVYTELTRIVDKGDLIALTFNDKLGLFAENKQSSFSVGNAELFRKQMLANEKYIYYVAVVKTENGILSVDADAHNENALMGLFDNLPDFAAFAKQEMPRLQDALAGDTIIINSSPLFNKEVITIAKPLYASIDGSKHLTVLIFCSPTFFSEAIDPSSEFISYTVNAKGDVLTHSNPTFVLNNVNFSNNDLVKQMAKSALNNGQTTYIDEDGFEQVGSFYKVDFAEIGVITTGMKDVAMRNVIILARRSVYFTALFLLIAIIIVYIFSKTLTKPITRLFAASQKIAAGDYDLSLKRTSRDEIGDLSDSFVEMSHGLQERERMKDAFGRFVNPEIANQAMRGELKLGGERKNAAVFFSDIRSFTAISETLNPEEVVEFLNEYMTAMVNCVNKTHGAVDKFIGDAIMAIWGAPVSHGNDTENAVNCALDMRTALIEFNKGRGGPNKPIIKIGCGINTGPLLAGQIGSQDRMEYTVIGDAVNLASRIEGLNKPFGTDVLISEESLKLVEGIYHVEAMKAVHVKGKSKPQQIFAVIDRKDKVNGLTSLKQVRDLLEIDPVDLSKVDADKKEEKFDLSESK